MWEMKIKVAICGFPLGQIFPPTLISRHVALAFTPPPPNGIPMGKPRRKNHNAFLPTYHNLPSLHDLHPPKLRNKITQHET